MRVEVRTKLNENRQPVADRLVLICETKKESAMLDSVVGCKVDDEGLISKIEGECRLSDGYGEHYLMIRPQKEFDVIIRKCDNCGDSFSYILNTFKVRRLCDKCLSNKYD